VRSHNSDPEGECGLDSSLEMPPEYINEFEKDFTFVSYNE
jgi:hypothetical protein